MVGDAIGPKIIGTYEAENLGDDIDSCDTFNMQWKRLSRLSTKKLNHPIWNNMAFYNSNSNSI